MRRLRDVAQQLLVSIDQLAQVVLVGAAYLLRLTDVCPSADETISSYVGRGAIAGRRWALIAERIIDLLFVQLGEEPGHCRRNVETAFAGAAPIA